MDGGKEGQAMSCSVIIPTLDAGEEIVPLIRALKAQTRPPDEVLVVDSQSEDGTAERARRPAVYHSHRLTLRQEYRRNALIGRTLRRFEARLSHAGEMGEGIALFRHVAGELVREGELAEAVAFAANCTARLFGNRMGRMREAKDMRTEGNADGNGVCGDSAGGV